MAKSREYQAQLIGHAYVKTLFNDWVQKPSVFLKGVESLPAMAAGLARNCLASHVDWQPTKAEEDIAAKAAMDLGKTMLAVAKAHGVRS